MDNRKTSQGFAKFSIKTLVYVVMIVVAIVCATTAYSFGSQIFSNEGVDPKPGTDMTFTVDEGTSIESFGKTLEEFNVIKSSRVFTVQSYLYEVKKKRKQLRNQRENSVIVDERIVTYMHSLEKPNNNVLEEIEQQAHIDGVPIIRKEMESFLRVMLTITKPKRILELGTAVGYSAILMSEAIEKDESIITIENYEKRIVQARDNFKKADKEDVITMLEGDAMEIMPGLEGDSFDFVFMDAAKAQYIHFLPEVMRLMKKGAVLITDNVLQEGDIIQSKYVVRRRDRTIHKRMREYLEVVKNHPELETTIVPIGDGITISVKK